MKLASLRDGSRDGRLHLVSRDHGFAVAAGAARTMQEALENWATCRGALESQYELLNQGKAEGAFPFDPAQALAPLPRAWQWLDGSTFESHGDLMDTVFGMPKKEKTGRPLIYQGVSDTFFGPYDDVSFRNTEDGIDFEGEFGIITDTVPRGTTVEEARNHVALVVLINDWSLRKLAPIEMKTGFGWIQAKPPCSMGPVAVTPDELGAAWRDSRVDLPLEVSWNGKKFGAANGYHMAFGFDELLAYCAYSRDLVAGTVVGSGTVSNANYREVGSSCIAERRGIELLDNGQPSTAFMTFGETVRMEAKLADGTPLFGVIDQKVVQGS